jgi:hypothetical protein
MMRVFFLAMTLIVFSNVSANAMSATDYTVLRESLFVIFSAGSIAVAAMIFFSLKGGSLGIPWLFFIAGFVAAGVSGVIQLLDTLHVILHMYDLRIPLLFTRAGSMLFFLTGLVLYKRGLQ